MSFTRRSFVQTAGVAAVAGTFAPTALAEDVSSNAEETFDCDLVIVGAGGAGLAAAVEAAEFGAGVIVLERMPYSGGGETGVEGIFAVGSSMQHELGIELSAGELVKAELQASQNRASGPAYVDMVHASGSNVDWLLEHGVTFMDVDSDSGTLMIFHRFEGDAGGVGYVPAMETAAMAAGATFMFECLADELVLDESGSVTGVLATDADGCRIQVNASKGVVVATGGFAEEFGMVKDNGFNIDRCNYVGMAGHDGTAHRMCVAAGAKSTRANTAYLSAMSVRGLPDYFNDGRYSFLIGVASPYTMWIDQNGERFTNEDFAGGNVMLMSMPTRGNGDTHVLFDKTTMDMYTGGDEVALAQLQEGLDNGEIKQADTLVELAGFIGVDPEALAANVDRYNGYCEEGADEDYGKDASLLVPVTEAPFYAVHITIDVQVSIGSIATDRDFRALTEDGTPIPGLYVAGVEGAMLWANLYTMNIAGGCNANNVNSGRVAARHALTR